MDIESQLAYKTVMMSFGYFVLFLLMLLPAILAMAMASRHWFFLSWNFVWYLVFAQVGLKAFGSTWGALPALFFALNYGFRAMRPQSVSRQIHPIFTTGVWRSPAFHRFKSKKTSNTPGSFQESVSGQKASPVRNEDVVIEAEFRKET